MRLSSPHQRKTTYNKYYSEHDKPCFGRQKQCTESDQTEDKKNKTYIFSFIAYFEAFLFLRFAVIIISHFITLGSICLRAVICA